METLSALLTANPDFATLPPAIQRCLPELNGPHTTNKDVYSERALRIFQREAEQAFGEQRYADGFAATAFSEWLRDVYYPDTQARWFHDSEPDFTLDPYAIGPETHRDCVAMSQQTIRGVRRISRKIPIPVKRAEVRMFTADSCEQSEWGEVQNMAYFVLQETPEGPERYFLVDAAAYYYNKRSWVHVMEGATEDEVMQAGLTWLANGSGMDHWYNPWQEEGYYTIDEYNR